uniref:Immunoglobulin V-set domain-containing protein n=1 Tax=Chelonoidis abingdonii TaxID=106734 RepID=A0A8C0IRU1_CHEAB
MQARRCLFRAEGFWVELKPEPLCLHNDYTAGVYLFWYRQYPNRGPQYILRRGTVSSVSNTEGFAQKRFSSQADGNSTALNITALELADTAVYHCALQRAQWQSHGAELYKNPPLPFTFRGSAWKRTVFLPDPFLMILLFQHDFLQLETSTRDIGRGSDFCPIPAGLVYLYRDRVLVDVKQFSSTEINIHPSSLLFPSSSSSVRSASYTSM